MHVFALGLSQMDLRMVLDRLKYKENQILYGNANDDNRIKPFLLDECSIALNC
jgi:hypothetical protein